MNLFCWLWQSVLNLLVFLRSALERRTGEKNSDGSVFYKKDKKVFLKRQVALKRRTDTFWVIKHVWKVWEWEKGNF